MLRKHWKLAGMAMVVAVGLMLSLGALASRQMVEAEKVVSLDQVPDAVRATLLAQGGTLEEIEMETANGQTVYEADITVDGREFEVKVAPDGKLIGNKPDDEDDEEEAVEQEEDGDRLSIDQVLDPAVKATILREAQGGTIEEIERESENGQVLYEADVVLDGQQYELKVAADGRLLGKEVDDEGEE